MAGNVPISLLPAAGTLVGTEPVPIVYGGVTSRTTLQAIANLAANTTSVPLVASENITAPALVSISSGFTISHANAATGAVANGFILTSVSSGSSVGVFGAGLITGLSGLTGGPVWLSYSTPGGVTQTPPSLGSGNYVQQIGMAFSSSSVVFNPGQMNGPL